MTLKKETLEPGGEIKPEIPEEFSGPRKPFKVLANRDFRLLWTGQGVSQLGTQMRIAAIGWQIYLLTHDPLQLGFIGLCRVVPLVLCSLIGGSAADAVDRRKLLLVTEAVLMACSAALALVTLAGIVNVWWIYGIIIISSATNAFERPSYSALIPSLVPRHQLPNALALGTVNWQAATVVGPGLGGVLIALVGVQGVYFVDAFSYVAVIAALLLIHFRPLGPSGQKISIEAALEGIRFVWHKKILVAIMLLDFSATFFASATTLLPIFATDVLHTNELGFGILSGAEALGAVTASLILAWFNLNKYRRPGYIVLTAVFFYSIFTIIFGFSNWFPLSLLCLALIGAFDTVSMVFRHTISQLITPDEMRGRMQSVNMIFFAGGPQFGEVEAGVVARVAGAPFSVITGGFACVGLVLLMGLVSKQLRNYEFEK